MADPVTVSFETAHLWVLGICGNCTMNTADPCKRCEMCCELVKTSRKILGFPSVVMAPPYLYSKIFEPKPTTYYSVVAAYLGLAQSFEYTCNHEHRIIDDDKWMEENKTRRILAGNIAKVMMPVKIIKRDNSVKTKNPVTILQAMEGEIFLYISIFEILFTFKVPTEETAMGLMDTNEGTNLCNRIHVKFLENFENGRTLNIVPWDYERCKSDNLPKMRANNKAYNKNQAKISKDVARELNKQDATPRGMKRKEEFPVATVVPVLPPPVENTEKEFEKEVEKEVPVPMAVAVVEEKKEEQEEDDDTVLVEDVNEEEERQFAKDARDIV